MASSKELFSAKIRPQLSVLSDHVIKAETGGYYKFHGMFMYALQRLTFVAAFSHYLETETLLTWQEAAGGAYLGVGTEQGRGKFHLDLEDYLGGLILVGNELVKDLSEHLNRLP